MEFKIKILDQAVKEDPDLLKFAAALQAMLDRMSMSHFRYGNMRDHYPHSAKPIDSARERMGMYDRTGNTENCLDAANFLIIEHLLPSHPQAHFKAQRAEESPGLSYRQDEEK